MAGDWFEKGGTVSDRNPRNAHDPAAEILASGGLVTMLGAVLAGVIAVVALSDGSTVLAGFLFVLAVLSFAASLVCFAADSRRSEGAPLPFPSWLRTTPDAAAELSAP